MVTPIVTLSARLTDAEHTQPVTQALRDLARVVNVQHTTLTSLAAALAAIPPVRSIAQIRQALQASGGSPLNITRLIPTTGGSSSGAIQVGLHADRLTISTSTLTIGVIYIETDRVAVYEWTATGWLYLGNLFGPMDVTLVPDTKPADLAGADNGFRVWATDYARLYIWSGAAWAEDNHNPSRYQLGLFNAAPDQNGWFKCDGSTYSRSTTTGGVTNYVSPDLITAGRFLRAAAAAGGTGDTSTHTHSVDPPDTTSGNDSGAGTVVAAGVGTTVAAHTHTHQTDIAPFTSGSTQALPPWYEGIPFIRL